MIKVFQPIFGWPNIFGQPNNIILLTEYMITNQIPNTENLNYSESSGPDKNIRLIESSDDRFCARKLTCYYMYSYLHDINLFMALQSMAHLQIYFNLIFYRKTYSYT